VDDGGGVGVGEGEGGGAGGGTTLTVADLEILPPVPMHKSEYVVVAVGETICEPEIFLVPVQPPEAVQELALVDDQLSVDDCPLAMSVGEAEKLSIGAGGGGGVGVGLGEGGVLGGGGGVAGEPTGVRDTSSIVSVPLLKMS